MVVRCFLSVIVAVKVWAVIRFQVFVGQGSGSAPGR